MQRWKKGLAALLAALMLVPSLPALAVGEEAAPVISVEEAALVDSAEAAPAILEETPVTPGEDERSEAEYEIQPMSLLPLEEKTITVDLKGYLPMELQRMKLSEILAKEIQDAEHPERPLKGTEMVAWSVDGDSYTVSNINDEVDMSTVLTSSYSSRRVEMIVGSGKQLDPNNVRYHVTIYFDSYNRDWLIPTLYRQAEDGTRTPVNIKDSDYYWYSRTDDEFYMEAAGREVKVGESLYLGLDIAEGYTHWREAGYTLKAYLGTQGDYDDGKATDITDQLLNQTMSEKDAGYVDTFSYGDGVYLTLELRDGDTVLGSETARMYLGILSAYLSLDLGAYTREEDGSYWDVSYNTEYDWDQKRQVGTHTFLLYAGYPADQEYYCHLYGYQTMDGDWIRREDDPGYSDLLIVDQYFENREAAEKAIKDGLAQDVKAEMLSGHGAKRDWSEGVIFSAFYRDDPGEYIGIKVKTGTKELSSSTPSDPEQPPEASDDTDLSVYSAKGSAFNDLYRVPSEHDSYSKFGYQNILVLDENADLTAVTPYFYSYDMATVYAGDPAVQQISGESTLDFSKGPVEYSVTAENKKDNRNYFVTFAKRVTDTPALFVAGANGPKETDGTIEREVHLDSYMGRAHDIFLANIGGVPMDGLNVTLTNAENVKLDEYWTVGGEGNDTLDAFETTYTGYSGKLPNIAKIRLVPDGVGEIKGKLKLTYGVGNDTMVFTITGVAGDPQIITKEIPVGVKYVPYGTMIQNTNKYDWNHVSYTLQSGELPDGVELRESGEIYGVPQEAGEFTFTVRMENVNSLFTFPSSQATYTLVVEENTDENVEAQTDEGYAIQTRVLDQTTYEDQEFKIEGALNEFMDLWLDGKRLERDTDYTVEEGSTKATILAKTFQDAGGGTHTLAAEYRVDGDLAKDLKKAAQNFNGKSSVATGTAGGERSPSTAQKPNQTPTTPEQTKLPFKDVPETAWYYNDVNWAYQSDLVNGVGNDLYDPTGEISQAMVVTLLARLNRADLSKFTDVTGTDVQADQWYSDAAVWAWKGGMLQDNQFAPLPPFYRGDMAIMLVKYLDYLAVRYEKPAQPVAFPDADKMTPAQNEAFQILYHNGIVKGVGGNYMAPDVATSRAEMATLIHRMADYLKNK